MRGRVGDGCRGFDPGGGGTEGIRALIQGGSPGGVAVRGGDVGPDPQYGSITE